MELFKNLYSCKNGLAMRITLPLQHLSWLGSLASVIYTGRLGKNGTEKVAQKYKQHLKVDRNDRNYQIGTF